MSGFLYCQTVFITAGAPADYLRRLPDFGLMAFSILAISFLDQLSRNLAMAASFFSDILIKRSWRFRVAATSALASATAAAAAFTRSLSFCVAAAALTLAFTLRSAATVFLVANALRLVSTAFFL
jgi:hypothetical protein